MSKTSKGKSAQEALRCPTIDDQGSGRADCDAPQAAPPRVYTEAEKEAAERALRFHNSPAGLLREIRFFDWCRKDWPKAHRQKVCSQEHDHALRMRELNPTLPPVPAYTDNPAVDEKNLRQWCIDAQAPVADFNASGNAPRRKLLCPLLVWPALFISLAAAVVYCAWIWGQGDNLWQKILASLPYLAFVLMVCLGGFLLHSGEPGRRLFKRWKGEE